MNSRTMQALPVVTNGKLRCRLPVCDATALVLADALVESDGERRSRKLCAALVLDPALAVWAILSVLVRHATGTSTGLAVDEKWNVQSLAEMLSAKLPR